MHKYVPKHGVKIGTPDARSINSQSDRQKHYCYRLIPGDGARINEPEVQSFDLSDHLILQ